MFDIREIKSIPSYQAFGRLQQAGCRKNYDTAAKKIAELTAHEWCTPSYYAHYLVNQLTPSMAFIGMLEEMNDCGRGRILTFVTGEAKRAAPWNVVNPNTEREVCHD